MVKPTSVYVNPNTWGFTSNIKNTAKNREISAQHLLIPVDDMMKVINTPIKLATKSSLSKESNSVNISDGQRIMINDGYVLTVNKHGVEASSTYMTDTHDKEAYIEAHDYADALTSLLRNASGIINNPAYSTTEYVSWTEKVSDILNYIGIDGNKDFTVNGMQYSKNDQGFWESEAKSEAKAAYEQMQANNRTYEFADEKTKKQINYISEYYLKSVPSNVREEWFNTLEETGVNPFRDDLQGTLRELATEQDFLTGGNDNLFGDTVESCVEAVEKILERIGNPLGVVSDKKASYLNEEKKFYTTFLTRLENS